MLGLWENLFVRSLVRSVGWSSIQSRMFRVVFSIFSALARSLARRAFRILSERIFLFAEWPWLLFWRARLTLLPGSHFAFHIVCIQTQLCVCVVHVYGLCEARACMYISVYIVSVIRYIKVCKWTALFVVIVGGLSLFFNLNFVLLVVITFRLSFDRNIYYFLSSSSSFCFQVCVSVWVNVRVCVDRNRYTNLYCVVDQPTTTTRIRTTTKTTSIPKVKKESFVVVEEGNIEQID